MFDLVMTLILTRRPSWYEYAVYAS